MRKLLSKSMITRYIYSNRIRTLFDVFSRGNSPKVSPHNEFFELSIAVYTITSKQLNWQKQYPCLATVLLKMLYNITYISGKQICYQQVELCQTQLLSNIRRSKWFGDIVMLVTILGVWWQNFVFGVIFWRRCWWPKWPKLSPKSKSCHQHISSPT